MIKDRCILACLLCAIAGQTVVFAQNWENARLIAPYNDDTKSLSACGAHGGGFHFSWSDAVSGHTRYLRYFRDGTTSAPSSAYSKNFHANPQVAESGGEEIWIVFEDWKDAVEAAVVTSRDGVNWSPERLATDLGHNGHFKHPSIVPLGGPYSYEMLVTANDAEQKRMRSNRWDGFRFLGTVDFGSCDTTYQATGSCSEPNGGAYRTYGHNNDVYLNYWDGTR